MDRPYRGRDDFCPEEQEERHSFFQRGPPPPRPHGEGEFDERHGFGDRREYDDDFPPGRGRYEGSRFGEDDYGGRRDDPDREGGDFQEGGYPPEGRPHFPHMGFHRRPPEDYPVPPEDDEPPPHFLSGQSGYHHEKQASDENVAAESVPAKPDVVGEAAVTSQMDSLSLDLPQGRLLRIFCKQDSGFNLAVDHKSLKMLASDTEDEAQQWIKDASHGFRIKDSYGNPAFSLVNKKTKKVLKHANKEGQQVLLVDYQADVKDDEILWTESQDFGEGFKTIRAASNTLLNLTVFEGHKKIRNGSALLLDTWHKGDHQLWKLFPL